MIDEIKDGDLIIAPNHIKIDILKEISKKKKIINCKFMTIEEFKRRNFETYDEKSIYYFMKEYGLNYLTAKEYLNNIFIKHKNIQKYYDYLKKENLLIKKYFQKPNRIVLIGYDNIEPYIVDKIKELNLLEYKQQNKQYFPKILEFQTQTDELVYAAERIIDDLENNKLEDMYLVIPSEEYYSELKRIFTLYDIPINLKDNNSIYSTKTAKDFLKTLNETRDIKKSLEVIPQNNIYNKIIDIINRYIFVKQIDDTYLEIITSEIKNAKLDSEEIEGALKVINYNEIYDKSKHYYILGLNQNVIPKIYSDDGIIEDKYKKDLRMFTANEKNKNEVKLVTNILKTFPNIYVSYKKEDSFQSYYPSSIIDDLNLEVEKKPKPKYNHSNNYNKLLLSSLLDSYINYNEEDERIYNLYPLYKDIDYKTYDNKYTEVESKKIQKVIKEKLTLSYSSMNNYFLCPFKYYIENILKLNPYKETFAINIGNIFHSILEKMYEKDFDFDTEFTKRTESMSLSPSETFFLKKLYIILKEDIEVIKMQDNHSEFKEKLTERKITIDKSKKFKISFVGIVDKISILDNYIVITDYKTGNNDATLENIDDGLNLQLPTYIYLIKNEFKESKIAGFYLQRLINTKPVDKEESYGEKLKLNGYTINNENIIRKIDDTYTDSMVIKGMRKSNNGFYGYTKLISEEEIEKIYNIVEQNVEKVIKAVEKTDFKINPKRLKNELISCRFCKYQDLCFYKEEDITDLKQKTLKEIVGDENA